MDVYEYLRNFKAPYKQPLLKRLQALPANLQVILPALLIQTHDWHATNKHRTDLLEQLDKQPATIWPQLCQVLFPQFADTVTRVLEQILPRQPYTVGYYRRAFRHSQPLTAYQKWSYLEDLWQETHHYEGQTLEWFAIHAGLLDSSSFGLLLAASLDENNAEVWQILRQTAAAEHPIARMGRHVPVALLASAKPEAWELAENLLLAAQRQEGLRQVILEAADECHPQAFVRFLQVVLDNNLLRFAATLRAACVWLGLDVDVTSLREVRGWLALVLEYLQDPAKAKAVLATLATAKTDSDSDAIACYLALFSLAMQDADMAAELAQPLLEPQQQPQAAVRMAAAQFLLSANKLRADFASQLIKDPDPRLGAVAVAHGCSGYRQYYPDGRDSQDEAKFLSFEELCGYMETLPPPELGSQSGQPSQHQPLLFAWLGQLPSRSDILYKLPRALGERPLAPLAPYVPQMNSDAKQHILSILDKRLESQSEQKQTSQLDAPTRQILLELLQDRNSMTSQKALEIAVTLQPNQAEVQQGIVLLKRKSADLRRALIRMLAQQPQPQDSVRTLLTSKNTEQRQAGLQLLLTLNDEVGTAKADGADGSKTDACAAANEVLLTELQFSPKNSSESTLYQQLTQPSQTVSLRDGLGLFDPQQLTQPPLPQAVPHDYPKVLARGVELLRGIDQLITQHHETPLATTDWDGAETVLLGNARPYHLRNQDGGLLLAELWKNWWQQRPNAQASDVAALLWAIHNHIERKDTTTDEMLDEVLNDTELALDVEPDTAQDAAKDTEQQSPSKLNKVLTGLANVTGLANLVDLVGLRDNSANNTATSYQQRVDKITQQVVGSVWGPLPTLRLSYRRLVEMVARYLIKHASDSQPTNSEPDIPDINAQLALDARQTALSKMAQLDPVAQVIESDDSWHSFDPRELLAHFPLIDKLTSQQQQRLFWLELYEARGFAKLPRQRLEAGLLISAHEWGLANVHDLLDLLIGESNSKVSYYYNYFTELSRYTRRKQNPDWLTSATWEQAVSDVRDRVLEIELARGDLETSASLPALALQSVYGAPLALRLLAGMGKNPLRRGYSYSNQGKEIVFSHLLRVSYPTNEDSPERVRQLAADYKLKDQRLLDLAMFAPQWASLLAQTLEWQGLGSAVYWLHAHTKDTAWGVPEDIRKEWEAEVSERTPLTAHELMSGAVDVAWFRRVYEELGAQRFEVLLKAAKYASSSGGHKRAELFAGALLAKVSEEQLLERIEQKRHQDSVRALGLLPVEPSDRPTLQRRYLALSDFRKGARKFGAQRQASERLAADIGMSNLARSAGYSDPQRLMWSMEASMAPNWQQRLEQKDLSISISLSAQGEASLQIKRGDKKLKAVPAALKKDPRVLEMRATVKELKETRSRMKLALEEAMVRGDHFSYGELQELSQHPVIAPMLASLLWLTNEEQLVWWPTEQSEPLAWRIAHPHDLFVSGQWQHFQQQVMQGQIVQPFKQVFREYYPLTAAEQEASRSSRYSSHHVQPSQAMALLKSRGWVAVPDEGIRKTYHAEGLNVWLDSDLLYGTPSEVEGLPLNAVYFTSVGQWEALPLAKVPPRLLSETLRDLDLVVSVAHVGGVDPEASQSTVAMRQTLLAETLPLLRLANVRLENDHALIAGHYANYTVHLGSGSVQRQAAGALCIIAVHNQQQGRIFLPFADPDPRTAEVISKVLLLAEDKKILDPTILEQLR